MTIPTKMDTSPIIKFNGFSLLAHAWGKLLIQAFKFWKLNKWGTGVRTGTKSQKVIIRGVILRYSRAQYRTRQHSLRILIG